jgi:hypothetical protein
MNDRPLIPAHRLFSVAAAAPVPVLTSANAIAVRPLGLLVVVLAAALLAGCNAKDNAGSSKGTTSANQSDQSNQSNGHMDDDNQGTGTRQEGDDNRGGGMMQQGRGESSREMDTMQHGMNNGNRGKTMMHRGMSKGHRMGM